MANFTVKVVNYSKWVDMFAAQKNEARRVYGETSIFMPGRTDVRYPNLTGTQWLKLKAYWKGPVDSVHERVKADAPVPGTAIRDSATRAAWRREYDAYQNEVGWVNTALATGFGNSILPEALSVGFWRQLEPLILRADGIFSSPRPYEMLMDALAEQAQAIAKAPFKAAWWLLPSVPTWMKWAGIGLGAFYVTHLVTRRRD